MSQLNELMDDAEEELVAGSPQQRNWKGIGIALLVILVICAMITLAVFLLTPLGDTDGIDGSVVSLVELLNGTFRAHSADARWISGSRLMYISDNGSLMMVDTTKHPLEVRNVAKRDFFSGVAGVSGWLPSSGGEYVALVSMVKKVWRHSTLAQYTIVTVPDNVDENITSPGYPVGGAKTLLRGFQWNPASSSKDFTYIVDNTIYYQNGITANRTVVLSNGQNDSKIYTGVADWLYEEEILATDKALWWSKSGNSIAFAVFNDTAVREIRFARYGSEDGYPKIAHIPYTKVGLRNKLPTVSLYIWDKNLGGDPVKLQVPKAVLDLGEYYLLSVSWLDGLKHENGDEILLAVWANRVQNITYYTSCGRALGNCVLGHVERFERGSMKLWAEPPTDFEAEFSTKTGFFTVMPETTKDNVYNHIANVTFKDKNLKSTEVRFPQLGYYDVSKIVGYNKQKDEVFFLASSPNPWQRHLYKTSSTSEAKCVTCFKDDDCSFQDVEFASDTNHYVLKCLGPGLPKTLLKSLTDPDFEYQLVNNTELANTLSHKALPRQKIMNVPLEGGYEAIVKVLLPPELDENDYTTLYPMVLKTYAGPSSNEVSDERAAIPSYDTHLASELRYVVVTVDARGSGHRGWKYKAPLYRRLGSAEIEDQLFVARYLADKLPYVDNRRVGIWGWSYGGFATGHVLLRDVATSEKQNVPRVFKCGATVAPVTHFKYYDAAYTERYMGYLKENQMAYEATSLMSKNIRDFHKVDLLVAHGSADDNVHFQNTALWIRRLEQENVQFQFMMYTNQQHSISEGRYHLYTMLDNFWKRCFYKEKTKTK